MIPSGFTVFEQNFETEEQPTYTYKMNLGGDNVCGYTDGIEAMKQVIYKILSTERYQYLMYSGNYGIELQDLYGQPISYVCPELERRIAEALTWDERIESVSNFEFNISKRGVINVAFTVNTVFGSLKAEKEVNF